MKYYIQTLNGSGIEVNDFSSFVSELRELAIEASEEGYEDFSVSVDAYLEGEDR